MKKGNKIISILLAVCMLMTTMSVAFAEEKKALDPFNNDLFSVVKELTLAEDDDYLSSAMAGYYSVPNDDYSMEKIVYGGYDENGEKFENDITDYLPEADMYSKLNELMAYESFNDGLKYNSEDDEYGCPYCVYRDINGNEIFSSMEDSQVGFYRYNLGLLLWRYSSFNINNDNWNPPTTTFINIMTDKKEYLFNADFTEFNDNGYALMETQGKRYLVKLKNGIIPTVTFNSEKLSLIRYPLLKTTELSFPFVQYLKN